MVRERKCCVNLIAIDGIWVDGPATNHRHAFAWNSFQHVRPIRAGRADQNFSCNIIRPVTLVFTKRLPQLFVDARHLVNGAVEHGSQSDTVEWTENFLRLSQRIAQEDGHFASLDCFAAERDYLINHLLCWGKPIAWKAEVSRVLAR